MYKIPFKATYQNAQGITMIDAKDLPLPEDFKIYGQPRIVLISANGWGGDHVHERREAFVGLNSNMTITWRDNNGRKHQEQMMGKHGELFLFVVSSNTPHLIKNLSKQQVVLYELWDRDGGPAAKLSQDESLQ